MLDRCIEIDETGQAFLVDGLGGWAYLHSQERGAVVLRSRFPVTVTRIEPGDPWWRVYYKGQQWDGSAAVSSDEARSLAEQLDLIIDCSVSQCDGGPDQLGNDLRPQFDAGHRAII